MTSIARSRLPTLRSVGLQQPVRALSSSACVRKVYAEADEPAFTKHVLDNSGRLVLVDWNAVWCQPCKLLAPTLHKLATTPELTGGREVDLVEVDVDENADLAAKYKIRAMPTVMAFQDGKQVGQFVGVKPEDTIREWLKSFS